MTILEWRECDLVVDCRLDLAEGPVWGSPAENSLYWVGILDGSVHRFNLSTHDHDRWDVGQPVGSLAIRMAGGLILAMQDGFATMNTQTKAIELIAPVENDDRNQRMNDGTCDSSGRFWAGTMSANVPVAGSGSLYRLNADGSVDCQLGDITISNGIGWSPDDSLMYFVDTPTSRIDSFDFDPIDGQIANRRCVVEIPRDSGSLDGLAVDEDGFIWVAVWGAGEVRRYSPGGEHVSSLKLPVSAPSSCAFGGVDLGTLFVTTARLSLSSDELIAQPTAGGIYAANVGVRGLPVTMASF